MTLSELGHKACEIMGEYEETASIDADFDGGEFSGPASASAEVAELTKLAENNGYTYDELMGEVVKIANEEGPMGQPE